jgi:hypothetical protein
VRAPSSWPFVAGQCPSGTICQSARPIGLGDEDELGAAELPEVGPVRARAREAAARRCTSRW